MADKITTSLAEAKILVMEGQAGYSPQIEVLDIAGGHQIRITTKVSDTQYQTDVFNVMDGEALDSDAIAQAVADYLSTHPISAPVTSVNGKTGEVDLDADDVSAATSQVSISGNVITIEDTARGTIAAYAITPASIGAGTYSKPSDGIPKTDLASDVQTSLGKADTALQQHQSLANCQTKAITDTGCYFTTDTVEGALQEIGAELAGVNTLIGSGVIS